MHQRDSLTRRDPENDDIALRFELYIAGMEVANAYTELNDPDLQEQLFKTQLDGLPEENPHMGMGLLDPIVVCNDAHRFLVAEQLRQIEAFPSAIILEPVGRNTAPAAAVAAARILEQGGKGEDPVLLVLPADHVIRDAAAFRAAVEQGAKMAAAGKLVTFGIAPTHAETGYGYVKARPENGSATPVEAFVEKPVRLGRLHHFFRRGDVIGR